MSSPVKRLSLSDRLQLGGYLEFHCPRHPRVYSECLALARSFEARVSEWHERPIALPRGVDLAPSTLPSGIIEYAVQWPGLALRRPPIEFHDPAVAATVVWTVYMLRRPWAVDGPRLAALVDDPPVPRARLLGTLVSLRLSARLFLTASRMLDVWARLVQRGLKVIREDAHDPLKPVMKESLDRLILAIRYMSDLLDVDEPNASLHAEIYRWRWMLLDYLEAFSPSLADRLEALPRCSTAAEGEEDQEQLWREIGECRRLEAFAGLLLARASMIDSRSGEDDAVEFVDPLATRATGSLAWWCRLAHEALEDPSEFGERLPSDEIETHVAMARDGLAQIDDRLLGALLDTFPSLRS